ncbi:hypothetical protein [Herbidospora sp. NBRC 101105]|uniref:hypothetical protein n=1 Tax=Herbidospora sp. NBRC 101105 TaxID=3032195 RepID=UPI00249FDB48|nr:hypothetical protein [Herbidospora sp. NBRC 101105]GLX98289.1 hypothetical protein Hesp01_62390 [Herbidospora sp. NBRC 101105]
MTWRSAEEIRDYLIAQLNLALRRSGMWGGEISLRLLLEHVACTEGKEHVYREEEAAMRSRDASYPTGVRGAVRHVLGDDDDFAVASVYAEVARAHGWLHTDRLLTAEEYASMRAELAALCDGDRLFTEVRHRFGPPSVRFGTNPDCEQTLAYATGNVADPMVFLHFWNRREPGTEWPVYQEPALLAARCGTGRFSDTFTFTPLGGSRTNLQLSRRLGMVEERSTAPE